MYGWYFRIWKILQFWSVILSAMDLWLSQGGAFITNKNPGGGTCPPLVVRADAPGYGVNKACWIFHRVGTLLLWQILVIAMVKIDRWPWLNSWKKHEKGSYGSYLCPNVDHQVNKIERKKFEGKSLSLQICRLKFEPQRTYSYLIKFTSTIQ